MKTTDCVNFTFEGDTVRFLSKNDVIEATDFVRSDPGLGTLKPDIWDAAKWHKVSDELPAYVGKTVEQYFTDIYSDKEEFIRLQTGS